MVAAPVLVNAGAILRLGAVLCASSGYQRLADICTGSVAQASGADAMSATVYEGLGQLQA